MTRIIRNKRNRAPTRKVPGSVLRKVLKDERQWAALGVVIKPENDPHFSIEDDGIFVEVELVPDRIEVTAQLSTLIGGPGLGVFTIPEVGAQVLLCLPAGMIDFCPTIVGIFATGQPTPSRVAESRTIIVTGTKNLEIIAPETRIGANTGSITPATDGVVHGTGIDPFTGSTYAVLGNTSGKLLAEK